MSNFYESDDLVDQYLLFHYGTADDQLPYPFGPRDALFYPIRCVSDFLRQSARSNGLWIWAVQWGGPPSSYRDGPAKLLESICLIVLWRPRTVSGKQVKSRSDG